MKFLGKGKFAKGLLAVAVTAAMSGCFDDSDGDGLGSVSSGTDTVATTTTNFSVDLSNAGPLVASTGFDWKNPLQTLIPKAFADTDDLNLENFQIVIVDGDGNVTETIDAEDIIFENLGNGQYELIVPGRPQLNCLIAVNLNEPLVIQAGESIADAGALFTPTTEEELEIDLESTVAFQQFLESIESDAFDEGGTYDVTDPAQVAAVDEILDNVVEALEDLDLEDILTSAGGLDVLLNEIAAEDDGTEDSSGSWQETLNNAIETIVEEVIEEEIANIVNATETTITDLVEGGGLYFFEADVDEEYDDASRESEVEIEAEYFVVTTSGESIFVYDDDEGEFVEEDAFDPEVDEADDDLVLTADGWVNTADGILIVEDSIDTDAGSLIIQDLVVDTVQESITTLQATDLEGENIADFIGNEGDEEEFAVLIDSDAVFSEGALAVKIEIAAVNDIYRVWYDAGNVEEDGSSSCPYNSNLTPDQLGGNCEAVHLSNPDPLDDTSGEEQFTEEDYALNGVATEFDEFISDTQGDLDSGTVQGFQLWSEELNRDITVELVDTGAADGKSVYFYYWVESENDSAGFTEEELMEIELADGEVATWSEVTPDGLGEGESIILIDIPDEVQEIGDFDEDERTIALAVIDGFVRRGNFVAADQVLGDEWVFNSQVATDVLAAFDFMYADALSVDCYTESDWDEDAFLGFGGPVDDTQFTIKAFEAVVDDCGGIDRDFTTTMLTENTWYDGTEELTFNDDFTGSFTNDEGDEVESFDFTWSVNDTANDGIPNGVIELDYGEVTETGSDDENYTLSLMDYYAPVGYDEESGQVSLKVFSTNSLWYTSDTEDGPLPEGTGEIWESVWGDEAFEGEDDDFSGVDEPFDEGVFDEGSLVQ